MSSNKYEANLKFMTSANLLQAIYKNQKTGRKNRTRITWGRAGNVIVQGMSPNILGNVAKHSGKYRQIFRISWSRHRQT